MLSWKKPANVRVYRQHTKYLGRSTEWERTGVLGTNRRENRSVIFAMPVSPPVCQNLKARKNSYMACQKIGDNENLGRPPI